MSRSFPFKYKDALTERTLGNTLEGLVVKGQNDAELLLILKLLSGSLIIEHKDTNFSFNQRINYCGNDYVSFNQKWQQRFPSLVADELTAEQLEAFIKHTKHSSNRKFYKNILCELSYFAYYTQKKSFSSAFIFLYRILEHISYALPLIYASKTDSFIGTFNLLKGLLSEDNSVGELGFFKAFIETTFKDNSLLETSIEFKISLPTESEQEAMYSQLRKSCNADALSEWTDQPRVLAVKFEQTGSFIANIRNRFFHYMNGHTNNIESSNIPNIDKLFEIVNKAGLQWLATVFLEVVANSAKYNLSVLNMEQQL